MSPGRSCCLRVSFRKFDLLSIDFRYFSFIFQLNFRKLADIMIKLEREGIFLVFHSLIVTGVWRSLVARAAGGREVASSNLAAPIFLCLFSLMAYLHGHASFCIISCSLLCDRSVHFILSHILHFTFFLSLRVLSSFLLFCTLFVFAYIHFSCLILFSLFYFSYFILFSLFYFIFLFYFSCVHHVYYIFVYPLLCSIS